jgi:hypothetical protein
MKRLFCYVDETGQDTLGRLFVVAIVVTDDRRPELESMLAEIETTSGKYQRKWMKARDMARREYIAAVAAKTLPLMIYARQYTNTGTQDYDELELRAAAEALRLYREANGISADDYDAIITIDGLSKTMVFRAGTVFRRLGVRTRKVVGKSDETSTVIRLADAIAGLVREAQEGREVYKALEARLERAGKLHEI